MAISKICKSVPSRALDRALDKLDASSRQAFVYHLKQRSQIDLTSDLTLSQMEEAMSTLFGRGSTLFLARLYAEMRQDMAP